MWSAFNRWFDKVSGKVSERRLRQELVIASIIALIGFFFGVVRSQIVQLPKETYALIRVLSNPDRVPISQRQLRNVEATMAWMVDSIQNQANGLYTDILDKNTGTYRPAHEMLTTWELAQVTTALCTVDPTSLNRIGGYQTIKSEFSKRLRDARFKETNDQEIDHDAPYSWALISHSRCNALPDARLVDAFIYSNAHISTGWRRIHLSSVDPETKTDEFASSYATTMGLWAVSELLEADFDLEDIQRGQLFQSGKMYASNIAAAMFSDGVHLRDYPRSEPFFRSWSLGGFGLYALRRWNQETGQYPAIRRSWTKKRMPRIEVDGSLASMQRITDLPGYSVIQDQTRYWDFPWVLLGHLTAYEDASTFERVSLLIKIESLLEKMDNGGAPFERVRGRNWILSEFIIALDVANRYAVSLR